MTWKQYGDIQVRYDAPAGGWQALVDEKVLREVFETEVSVVTQLLRLLAVLKKGGGESMKYTVTLKDRETDYQRDYIQDYDYQDDTDDPERFYTADEKVKHQWLEGNYECDCNRALFLWNYAGEELPCNQYQNDTTRRIDLLKIVDATGRLIYNNPAC